MTDPRVVYDPYSGRWYASILIADATNNMSAVALAVSAGHDPTGSWWAYTVLPFQGGSLDQPKLAVTTDKVTETDNFLNSGGDTASAAFLHEDVVVMDKGALIANSASVASVHYTVTSAAPLNDDWNLIPAQIESSWATQYLVTHVVGFSGDVPAFQLDVVSINGQPGTSAVTWNDSLVTVTQPNQPPDAPQPGTTTKLDAGGNNWSWVGMATSAAWQSTATLVVVGPTRCGVVPVACIEYDALHVDVNSGRAVVLQDGAIASGNSSNALFNPAVGLDSSGNAWITASESGPNTYAQADAFKASGVQFPAGASPAFIMRAGTTYYCDGSTNTNSCTGDGLDGADRWGDYATVAPDDNGGVWLAQEYGGLNYSQNWGTWITDAQ